MSKRRSSRQMASRKRSRYTDPETEDELMTPSEDDSDAVLPRELDDSPRPRQRAVTKTRHRPKTRSKSTARDKAKALRRPKRRSIGTRGMVIGRPKRARDTQDRPGVFNGPSDGVRPPWTQLPETILKDIFYFGAQPLNESNASWLLNAARTCKSFMAPALEAFYHCPQVYRPAQLWSLLSLMRKREGRIMNYNTKVKRLDVDIRRLVYKAYNKPLFDLGDLLEELPMLQHLEIVHPENEPPFRPIKLQKWDGLTEVCKTLASSAIRLATWRWTRNMLRNDPFQQIMAMHLAPSFQTLHALVLCGFADAGSKTQGETEDLNLWHCLSLLPQLRDVSFISCTAPREQALALLPPTLERLELSNCSEVNSEVLAQYLVAGGAQLRNLVLNHNSALDLGFLPGLKLNCPRLQRLDMSFIFYSEYEVVNDAAPLYDDLLADDEIPSWPGTMREINLQHMQKCTANGVNNLCQSLVDSASELPDLRYIVIRGHTNMLRQERVALRDQWNDKLRKIFERPDKAPFAHNGSKRQYSIWKEKRTPKPAVVVESAKLGAPNAGPSQRRSERVAAVQIQPLLTQESVSFEDTMSTTSPPDDSSLQGRCIVVDFHIDNQRPREVQLTEQDFLDAEPSGDEDWNENADVGDEDGYAW